MAISVIWKFQMRELPFVGREGAKRQRQRQRQRQQQQLSRPLMTRKAQRSAVITVRSVPALHFTVLYCTILYCTVLYCTVLWMQLSTTVYCLMLWCNRKQHAHISAQISSNHKLLYHPENLTNCLCKCVPFYNIDT